MQDTGIKCIKCGYDMRLLNKPQCPECGWKFRLDEYERFKNRVRFAPLFWLLSIATCLIVIFGVSNQIRYTLFRYSLAGKNVFCGLSYIQTPLYPRIFSPIFMHTYVWIGLCLINTAICHIRIRLWSIICRDVVFISLFVWSVFYLYKNFAPPPAL